MNKRNIVIAALLNMAIGTFSFKNFPQQNGEPWRKDQLIEPSVLAATLK